MKLSDYVARFLAQQGIRHVFAITGGASAHLIDSVGRAKGIDYICPAHEQAGAMAADGYARVTGGMGAAIATSGPGATNMLTGTCCSYYDSVPVLYITGQVSTFRLKKDLGVRQLGFQESDIVDIFRPVTKYAVLVEDKNRIRYELEKAVFTARSGRPGPVLIDIPDNVQREEIDPEKLDSFSCPQETKGDLSFQIREAARLLEKAQRPVLILGWGVELAGAEKEAREFAAQLKIPVALTWAMRHLLAQKHPFLTGPFGTHGSRYGNFAVQNADFVLSVGARLDTRQAGSPAVTFARGAKKIVVDIDPHELAKFKRLSSHMDLLICADAKDFLKAALSADFKTNAAEVLAWNELVRQWKKEYPICPEEFHREKRANPYVFVQELSRESPQNAVFFVDSGCSVAWMSQAFEFKAKQKLYSAFNNTPMGYALPASIGGCFASKKPMACVTGDGGLQMNIQELATVIRHKLPIKIFLFNNRGYSMIRQTQDQWLSGRHEASSVEKGLAFPDFIKVAKAYGFKTVLIRKNSEMRKSIRKVWSMKGPVFCDVRIPENSKVVPIVKYGRPIEDSEPLLHRTVFKKSMLIEPHPSSVQG